MFLRYLYHKPFVNKIKSTSNIIEFRYWQRMCSVMSSVFYVMLFRTITCHVFYISFHHCIWVIFHLLLSMSQLAAFEWTFISLKSLSNLCHPSMFHSFLFFFFFILKSRHWVHFVCLQPVSLVLLGNINMVLFCVWTFDLAICWGIFFF